MHIISKQKSNLLSTYFLHLQGFLAFLQKSSAMTLNATDEVLLEAVPPLFTPGVTSDLRLNCSFDPDLGSDFSVLMSLILSKADGANGYT